MTDKELFFKKIAAGKKHQWYDRTVQQAKEYRAMVSGEGLDEMMHQFKPREEDEMFTQRKQITQQIVSSVCKNIRDIEYKVPRSNSITRALVGDEQATSDLQDILDKFWGKYSFDDYMDLRWIELNDTDPNAFLVIEWKPFNETERAQPYPFEVLSENVFDYKFDNNVLQWLIVWDGDDKNPLYTFYGKNQTLQLLKIDDKTVKPDKAVKVEIADFPYYYTEFTPHDLNEVPAERVGFTRDMATNGKTYLPPWWPAIPLLKNLITSKSEMDLTQALHVFPQKFVYTPRCQHKGCTLGFMPDGAKCPVCKGTGVMKHISAQDSIDIAMPKSPEEIFDLKKLVHYEYPPVDLLRFMDEYIDKLSQKALQMVYNSEIYSREMIAETATGREIDLQAVYDSLYPMVKDMAVDWMWGVDIIAQITDIKAEGVFTFSKDFKLKSLDGYYRDLDVVFKSDASPFIKGNIEDDIAKLIYAEDPLAYARFETMKRFYPFTGDSKEEVMLKMTQNHVPKFYKTLYACYGWIFDELARETEGFYMLIPAKQWELIKAKIDSLMEDQTEPVFNFNEPAEN